MTQQNANDKNPKQNEQKSSDQGGHAGMRGHGGQHSGGMGGEHGGDLHDVGSAQSGMTGGSGMGGNESKSGQSGRQSDQPADIPGGEQYAGQMGGDDTAEVQQSAQREGMGHHRHTGRGGEQALDGAADVDKLGNQQSGAAKTGDGGPRR